MACVAAGFTGLLDPDDRSEEEEEEDVGATGEKSSCFCCCGWNCLGGVGGIYGGAAWLCRAGAQDRAGAGRAAAALRSLFLERDLRFWNQ
jgi:hypothetical protein